MEAAARLDAHLSWRWWVRVSVALARRPGLWGAAAAQVFRLARPGWWRSWPPLPFPDPAYLRFRLETAYGAGVPSTEVEPLVDDVVTYLHWCRELPR